VAKPLKTEEELKANILDIYSKFRKEVPDRRQTLFGQLCDNVFRWCTGYLFHEASEMGLEIVEALGRIVKKEIEEDFLKYLVASLINAKNEYYRKRISSGIKYPKKIRNIEKSISLQESNVGRILSEEEKIEHLSKKLIVPPKRIREYLGMINNKNTVSLTSFDDKEKPILDFKYDPESIFFSKFNAAIFRETVEEVLSSKQDRTREFYKALFTAYCINNSIDFEGFASILNVEILEKYLKTGKKPEQNEIYLMYHPDVKKESAGVRASEMLKTLLNDLETALELKEKI